MRRFFVFCPPFVRRLFPLISAVFGGQLADSLADIFYPKNGVMAITISADLNRKGDKKWYTFEWGKASGQRRATGIFTYTRPKDALQKQHNLEAKKLLEVKQSELTLDFQSIGSSFIPAHRIKENF